MNQTPSSLITGNMNNQSKLEPLLKYVSSYIELNFSSSELELLDAIIPVKKVKKGTVLLKAGSISSESYFNIKGCLRMYYIVDGVEKTANFYSENQFVTAYESYTKRKASAYYFECIEDCTLAVLSYKVEEQLLKEFPKLEVLSRLILEEELSTYQNIVSKFITLSPQERYLDLANNNSELLQRVPQYYLASYIGVSPESLSRIRKRIHT